MKVNYFRYCFFDQNAKKIFYDIRPLIDSFLNNTDSEFKASFKTFGDNLYLLNTTAINLFFFMRTRNDEIIQKINSSNLQIEDIREQLNADEQLGFSSYVYIDEDYIAFAGAYLAPKVNLFADFINQIISKITSSVVFTIEPIVSSLTKSEAKKLSFISKAYIKVPAEKKFAQDLLGVLGKDTVLPSYNLSYLEVTLKAEKDKNIEVLTHELIEHGADDAERFILSARAEIADNLRDYYIEESGGIFDTVHKGKKVSETEKKIVAKIEGNHELKDILNKARKYEDKQKIDVIAISDYVANTSK